MDDGSMVRLRDIESTLPPGFRFHPSDEELVCYYLRGKVVASSSSQQSSPQLTMVEVDLHVREPWDLPVAAKLGDKEWYFFSCRDRKYATGSRTNRATRHGYWKATGKDKAIHGAYGMTTMGMRKTLVFYFGRAPNGRRKSDWVMHEFRLVMPTITSAKDGETPPPMAGDWVMCRVFHKGKGEYRHGGSSSNHLIDMTATSPPPQPAAAMAGNNLLDGGGGGGQLVFPISTISSSATITSRGNQLLVSEQDHHALVMGQTNQDAMPAGDGGWLLQFSEEWPDASSSQVVDYGGNCCIQIQQEMLQQGGNYY